MANAIFNVMFNLISGFMSIVMTPINLIIYNILPDFSGALATMQSYLQLVGSYLSFALSYLGFYPELISVACLLLSAIMLIPFMVHSIKLVLRWYRVLMP